MALNIATIVWFYAQALEPKIAVYKIFLIYYFCNFTNTLICGEMLGIYQYKLLFYFLYNAAVLIYLFSGGAARKLVSGFWILVVQLLTELGGACTLTVLGLDISVIEHYTVMKNILVGMDTPLQWLLCIGFLKMLRGLNFQLDWKKMWMVIKCYFCELVIVCVVVILHWYFNAVMSATLLLSKFMLIVIMLYLVILLKTMETKQLTENKTKYLQRQSRMVLQYCNAINEKTANLEELRAEYEKKLNEVYAVVEKSRNDNGTDSFQKEKRSDAWKEAKHSGSTKTMDVAAASRSETENQYHFENAIATEVTNGILTQMAGNRRLEELYKKGDLTLKLDLSAIPAHTMMGALDLSALLYNMLENAYEAVERQSAEGDSGNEQPRKRKEAIQHENDLSKEAAGLEQQRRKKQGKKEKPKQLYYIKADAKREADRLTITVKNSKSPQQKISVYQDQWKTSKENKKIHGYGMGIIKSITEKYHGEMAVDYGQDWFLNKVTVNIGNE